MSLYVTQYAPFIKGDENGQLESHLIQKSNQQER